MPIAKACPFDDGTVETPINRESCMIDLVSSFITKSDNYDRNHGPIQRRNGCDHRVEVNGFVSNPLNLTIEQLVNDFPQHSVTCTLQCAGNRRHTMRTRIKEVLGVDWFDGAVMNCTWEGPRVRDILLAAGVDVYQAMHTDVTPRHVHFANYGGKTQQDEWYGGSIPFDRVMCPDMDVILAVKMNGLPLPDRHGFPVRAIVPGVLGARSVKWLERITVADRESPCFYQQRDYKVLPQDAVDAATAAKYWAQCPAMLDMPINSCVAWPTSESTITLPASGEIEVYGYAVPHGHQGPVVRVQVSGDEGRTWTDAHLEYGGKDASKWTWVLWNARIKMERGQGKKIFAKASDAGGNQQEHERSPWNLRGVAYNGYEAAFNLTID
ncbi:sulfite oxidase [Capronia coronata CBS 617.96]|uniref:Sulfite oxidase n=1 Tax=Capronia coronata CBS 617.96 TaxID=1182541 RepID=W9Y0D0_9EURO|nr:sulfite oxidase [Capronia coronata CBS 617.96]EXJ83090.1 sulfite oxidase [Capronia coronata CBS 617.96]